MRGTPIRPYAAQLLSLGGSALLSFLTAFLFSTEARGELAIFMLLGTLGGYFLNIGLPAQLLQAAANNQTADLRQLLGIQLPIAAIGAVALYSVLQGTDAFPFVGVDVLLIGCLTALVAALFNAYSWVEYGRQRFDVSTAARGIVPLAALAASLITRAVGSHDILPTAINYLLAQTVALGVLVVRNLDLTSATGDVVTRPLGASLVVATKYFWTQSATLLLARLPTIASGLWYGARGAAVTAIALSVSELQSSMPQMRAAITFAEAAKLESPRLNREYLLPAAKLLILGLIVTVGAGLAGSLLLGGDYSTLWQMVLIMSPGVGAMALASSGINILTVRSSYLIPAAALSGACILAAAGLWLSSPHLHLGIAAWSLVSAAVGAAICVLAARDDPRSGPLGREG